MSKKFFSLFLLCVCCSVSQPARAAEAIPGIESQLKQLTQAVNELKLIVENQQKEIVSLKAERAQVSAAVTQAPRMPENRILQGRWNPDIGVIADTVFLHDDPRGDEEGADRLSVRELEIIFGSAVDPYSRLDATLGISDFEDMELEEAYLTHFGLPWDVKARVGRFLPRIGKAISVHRDSLDTVDEPLVIQRYFGHHGYNKTGVDVSHIIELPWPVTHEATLGVLEGGNGEEGSLFGETRRRPTVYSHLKNYMDLDDLTGLEIGISHLVGSSDEDAEFEVNVLGMDATLIHRYADQRHVKLQGEAFHVSRSGSFEETEGESDEIFFDDVDDNRNRWGAYALVDWRFHPQWATGFRYDFVEPILGVEAHGHGHGEEEVEEEEHSLLERADKAYTGYLTFYQSEFARWRAQFTHIDLAQGGDDNQVMIQGTFAIGEHKHKLQ